MDDELVNRASILSHGERDVAGYLRSDPDIDAEEIADRRDVPVESVEKSISRIQEKTRRAFATIAQSPFIEEAARELPAEERESLRAVLRDIDEK